MGQKVTRQMLAALVQLDCASTPHLMLPGPNGQHVTLCPHWKLLAHSFLLHAGYTTSTQIWFKPSSDYQRM